MSIRTTIGNVFSRNVLMTFLSLLEVLSRRHHVEAHYCDRPGSMGAH
jgi:hypothetical protein